MGRSLGLIIELPDGGGGGGGGKFLGEIIVAAELDEVRSTRIGDTVAAELRGEA